MDTSDFSRLLTPEGRELLAVLADFDAAEELAWATRLRREHEPGVVAAALGQARLRQRGRVKFGRDAGRMFFTAAGVEQATRAEVAEHRARRVAAAGVRVVADLCCGIGADAVALARAGVRVVAVDRDPLTCAVAAANAEALGVADRVEVRCADVRDVGLDGFDAVFVDPARRTARGRVFDPEAYSPPLSFVEALAARVPCGAAKVAPGIPHEAVPAGMGAEWVSYGGDVKEAVLWWGRLAGEPLRATLLPGGDSIGAARVRQAPDGPVGRYLYEPDGAVIRAHLVAEVADAVGGALVDPTIAYVTADALVPTPFAAAYELTDVMPFNLKKLKEVVRERGIGTLTVKKRGSAVAPEDVRKRVKPSGPEAATVFLTRVAGAPAMLLGRPVTGPDGPRS
ncbi:class I SAM-dependent methyltransferase [Yinghuangia sp. ASG 101]|uniref:class I SAM-dependent methyltransferase n=1 Tax=Yinghuangia sp. ASG 101 TaxID=2896848 RepID=UPI001E42F9E6|nr:class I SAM-dependent methyltransferase [Yinghuangia sp. ASG 101]UGQ14574.1 class I SAM-dependent methyltransferase [Yinghuangia sp. ASG 101]